MQSGISASEELLSEFNTLLSGPTSFALLVTITSERLTPVTLLRTSSPSASFADNLGLLAPHIKPKEALYLLMRRYAGAPSLVAVTYVPDEAPVRQKMIFASTRLALVRDLGSEHFRESIFATTAAELTADGFAKLDAHVALDAPLTEEERSLGDVKRAEAEAGQGTGTREIHLSKTMMLPMASDVLAALKGVGAGERTLAMLKINPDAEAVELVSDSSSPTTIPDLVQALSTTEPRFAFFRYAHTHDGAQSSPVLFIFTHPATPGTRSIKNRMLYPLTKKSILTTAEQEAGLSIEKRFEVEEPAELTEALVIEELHPKTATGRGFSRPKRPGR